MKLIKEYTEFTDEEIIRIACEDWTHNGLCISSFGKGYTKSGELERMN